jgi:hypothetical protein
VRNLPVSVLLQPRAEARSRRTPILPIQHQIDRPIDSSPKSQYNITGLRTPAMISPLLATTQGLGDDQGGRNAWVDVIAAQHQFTTENPPAVKGLVTLLAPFPTNARGTLDSVVGFLYFRRISCVG